MANQSIAEFLRGLELRLAGIQNRTEQFAEYGIDAAWIQAGRNHLETLKQLDEEQEALKAQLRAKTDQLNAARKAAKQWRSRTDKRIYLVHESDPGQLKEYGLP